jgi:hypothetical protein
LGDIPDSNYGIKVVFGKETAWKGEYVEVSQITKNLE